MNIKLELINKQQYYTAIEGIEDKRKRQIGMLNHHTGP